MALWIRMAAVLLLACLHQTCSAPTPQGQHHHHHHHRHPYKPAATGKAADAKQHKHVSHHHRATTVISGGRPAGVAGGDKLNALQGDDTADQSHHHNHHNHHNHNYHEYGAESFPKGQQVAPMVSLEPPSEQPPAPPQSKQPPSQTHQHSSLAFSANRHQDQHTTMNKIREHLHHIQPFQPSQPSQVGPSPASSTASATSIDPPATPNTPATPSDSAAGTLKSLQSLVQQDAVTPSLSSPSDDAGFTASPGPGQPQTATRVIASHPAAAGHAPASTRAVAPSFESARVEESIPEEAGIESEDAVEAEGDDWQEEPEPDPAMLQSMRDQIAELSGEVARLKSEAVKGRARAAVQEEALVQSSAAAMTRQVRWARDIPLDASSGAAASTTMGTLDEQGMLQVQGSGSAGEQPPPAAGRRRRHRWAMEIPVADANPSLAVSPSPPPSPPATAASADTGHAVDEPSLAEFRAPSAPALSQQSSTDVVAPLDAEGVEGTAWEDPIEEPGRPKLETQVVGMGKATAARTGLPRQARGSGTYGTGRHFTFTKGVERTPQKHSWKAGIMIPSSFPDRTATPQPAPANSQLLSLVSLDEGVDAPKTDLPNPPAGVSPSSTVPAVLVDKIKPDQAYALLQNMILGTHTSPNAKSAADDTAVSIATAAKAGTEASAEPGVGGNRMLA